MNTSKSICVIQIYLEKLIIVILSVSLLETLLVRIKNNERERENVLIRNEPMNIFRMMSKNPHGERTWWCCLEKRIRRNS